MRSLGLALVVVTAIAMSGASQRPVASVRQPGDTFRVATFNIHKGADHQNRYDLQRTIDAIAAFDADLVGLQEVLQHHAQFNCDDQAVLIADGLRRLTKRPWTYVFARSWITENRDCLQRGRGNDVETEGLAILAPEPLVHTAHIRLAESRIGLLARVASMPDVPVVVTHLAASRRNQHQRVEQIAALLPWAALHGPGILMGDLNARHDAQELIPVLTRYRDAWAEAAARGMARGVASGSTRPGGQARIDYVLFAADAALTLESVEVREAITHPGSEAVSDHWPVIATFRRRHPSR